MTTTNRNTAAALRYFVRAVERAVKLRAPMSPEVLACTLGIVVREVPGARMALRLGPATGGGTITVDPTVPTAVQDTFIARGCASYLLRRSGKIKSALDVGAVAAALCHIDGVPVPLFAASGE